MNSSLTLSPNRSRQFSTLRRTMAAVVAGAGVAVVGVSAIPGTAQAAGVATGYRYLPANAPTTSVAVSPTALPNAESATLRYRVTSTNTLVRI